MAAMTLFDTDVLVDFLRGHVDARAELTAVPITERGLSAVSYMELMRGSRDRRELAVVEQFVSSAFATVVDIDEATSRDARALVHTYTLSHGLRVPDALVAATARTGRLRLITGNLRHYQFIPDLEVELPAYRKPTP
jgi:hypothetical protein